MLLLPYIVGSKDFFGQLFFVIPLVGSMIIRVDSLFFKRDVAVTASNILFISHFFKFKERSLAIKSENESISKQVTS